MTWVALHRSFIAADELQMILIVEYQNNPNPKALFILWRILYENDRVDFKAVVGNFGVNLINYLVLYLEKMS